MKIPNIIIDEKIKNAIIFYMFFIFGLVILNWLLGYVGLDVSSETLAKITIITIVLHIMYTILKAKLHWFAKVIIELLLTLMIYKTFVKAPIIDKISNWLVAGILIYLAVKFISKKIKGG